MQVTPVHRVRFQGPNPYTTQTQHRSPVAARCPLSAGLTRRLNRQKPFCGEMSPNKQRKEEAAPCHVGIEYRLCDSISQAQSLSRPTRAAFVPWRGVQDPLQVRQSCMCCTGCAPHRVADPCTLRRHFATRDVLDSKCKLSGLTRPHSCETHATQFRLNTPPKLYGMTPLRHSSSLKLPSRLNSESTHSSQNESDWSQT